MNIGRKDTPADEDKDPKRRTIIFIPSVNRKVYILVLKVFGIFRLIGTSLGRGINIFPINFKKRGPNILFGIKEKRNV